MDPQGVDGPASRPFTNATASRPQCRGAFVFSGPYRRPRGVGVAPFPRSGLRPLGGHPPPLLPAAAGSISGMRRGRFGSPSRPFIAAAQTPGRPRSWGVCLSVLAAGLVPPRCVGGLRWAAAAPPAAAVARQPPALTTPRRAGDKGRDKRAPWRVPPLPRLAGRGGLPLVRPCGLPLAGPPRRAKCRRSSAQRGLWRPKGPPLNRPAPLGSVLPAVRCPGVGPPCPLPSPSPQRGPGERKRLTLGALGPCPLRRGRGGIHAYPHKNSSPACGLSPWQGCAKQEILFNRE